MDTTTHDGGAYDIDQIYCDHVVGKQVTVVHRRAGTLLPPLLETHVDDVDTEREEEEDADDVKGGDGDSTSS